jgi:bacterial regulatory protein, fis family
LITLDSVQNLLAKMEQDHRPVPEEVPVRSRVEEPGSLSQIREQLSRGKVDLGQLLSQYEAAIISEALRQTNRLNAAADKLSISPQKLQYRMEKLKLK